MNEYDFKQTIYTPQLLDEIATAGLPAPDAVNTNDTAIAILYTDALTDDQQTTLAAVIANHVANPNYVPLALQTQINTLTGYLNNANPAISSTARAVMITNLAARLPLALLVTINAQIHAQTGA